MGNVPEGGSVTQSFQVMNLGPDYAVISIWSWGFSNDWDNLPSGDNVPGEWINWASDMGQIMDWPITFHPSTTGPQSGTVAAACDGSQTEYMFVTGNGVFAPIFSANTLVFGTQALNTPSAPQTITVTGPPDPSNYLTISSVSSSSGFAETNNCSTIDNYGQTTTCTITVTFTPTALGPYNGTLAITDNGDGSPQTITLIGEGIPGNPTPALADTIAAGSGPQAVAVNPSTNKIYVANSGSNNVTVIDGATFATTTVTDSSAIGPAAVAVNPLTNQIYVANLNSNDLTVIAGATNSTSTVPTGAGPQAVAVNPVTDKIYVANHGGNSVTVIDGATNSASTVPAGTGPAAVAVNPVTNKIYVANSGSNNLTVIDGATNLTSTLVAGTGPAAVAVNPVTNKIYVANSGSNNVTVIDGATNLTSTLAAGTGPVAVAVNPVANQIYVANEHSSSVTVINGATNATATIAVGTNPVSIAVDVVNDRIYVANQNSSNVTVIDGVTGVTATLANSHCLAPMALAVNPATYKVYVANHGSANVSVIDGATNALTTAIDPNALSPSSVAVNPVTNKIYVVNQNSQNVTVIDGATNTTTTLGAGPYPVAIAVNPVTNQIYVVNNVNDDGTVTVVDGATNATTGINTGENLPWSVAINPATNKIYVECNQIAFADFPTNIVAVIDGATNSTTSVPIASVWGNDSGSIAVNPVTNKIYVGNAVGTVTVIDGATNSTTTLSVGAGALAVNPVTNKIYVISGSNTVTVIDGATNNTTAVTVGSSPQGVAVNPVTNKVYVTNSGSGTVTVIDGATNRTKTVVVGNGPGAIAVNPVTNKIYVANSGSNTITVIDGATDITRTLAGGTGPAALAVNPVTNQVYVANSGSNDVTVITEQQVQSNPLNTAITPLADNLAASLTPSFNFTATSAFTPNAPNPDNLLFQVDTWQGPWTAATNNGGGAFSAQLTALQPGVHILYAYATDGQDATSINSGQQSSPLIGSIAAYLFVVAPNRAVLYPPNLAFGNQVIYTTSASQSITLINGSISPLTISDIKARGDYSATSCGTMLAGDESCTIDVTFAPTIAGPDNGTLTVVDDSNGTSGSTQTVSLTGTGTYPKAYIKSLSPATATVGAAAQTLTINGSYFFPTSRVTFHGVAHTPTFVSSTQLKIDLTTSDQSTVGTYAVVVTNPAPGGGESNVSYFTVNYPKPSITSLSPVSASAGAAAQTLTINGSRFFPTSTVTFHGLAHTPTFVSSTQLKINLSTSDQATGGSYAAVVTNPTPGGGESNASYFTVNNPRPYIKNLSPHSATAGAAAQTLTINGLRFVSTSMVTFHGLAHTPSFVSSTQLKILLSASDQARGGTDAVVVTNPAPDGGESNPSYFTVNRK
jgi:YVTN family beta-propeller protein